MPLRRIATLLLVTLSLLTFASPTVYADSPTTRQTVNVVNEDWKDAARDRTLPVRLYLPADASTPLPTIVVSHGLGDSRKAMAYACMEWASRGFVVLVVQHPGSDDAVWKNVPTNQRYGAILKAATLEQFNARCRDIKFALDELEHRNAVGGPLAGRIDVNRFAIAGHSFGSLAAQAIIGEHYATAGGPKEDFHDSRIKAAVLMSPGLEGAADLDKAFADITVPVFHFTGTVDVVAGLGVTTAAKRRVPFDGMNASDQYLMIFDRGDHIVFSGTRPAGANVERYEAIENATAKLSADFFEAYLKNDGTARDAIATDAAALGDIAKFEKKSPAAKTP